MQLYAAPVSTVVPIDESSSTLEELEIIAVFSEIADPRNNSGKRHQIALCLALFTLAIATGNQGFLAIGDWLESYEETLIELFNPPKRRLPSYSTIRRVLLTLDYRVYSAALARFFHIEALPWRNASDGR